MKNINMLNAIENAENAVKEIRKTGCEQNGKICADCPCLLHSEVTEDDFCAVERLKNILEIIEDNTLDQYNPNLN